ncbi:MAG TPA: alkaline phosphatase D family protein [Limnobacter sp.]|uniref:alkaline phosphatase D family protein n=1 Tax=Limnobacter sp. TaxID=2003368 RepID=UPI002E2F56FA|nr:alkaline phosphatase D family protein [Limnobacter sp.]HEX5485574.1 alkaline phosphatase D family protein [Limnobacter sp.]
MAFGLTSPAQPSHEILTLSDYRTRHAQYKQDADLRQLHLRYPFITIWDDHESADNSYHDGAANHTEGVEGKWVDRKAYSQQAYDEWMPIRLPEPGNRNRIFRTLKFGQTAEWILLDTRLYDHDVQAATPVNPLDPSTANADRHMIGDEQRAFLINNMRQSTSQWKLIGNQVVFHQWIIKPFDFPAHTSSMSRCLNGATVCCASVRTRPPASTGPSVPFWNGAALNTCLPLSMY